MKNQRGITIIPLIITVVILLILSGTLIESSNNSPNIQKYNKMSADVQILEDKILVFYNKYGQIPIGLQIEIENLPSAIIDKDLR